MRAHLLPLTNCTFNKARDKFITGSYDRTCKVWDTESGQELLSLEEHKNDVYTMAFNNPFGNLIVTGSFDRTAKIWDANNWQMKQDWEHIGRNRLADARIKKYDTSSDVIN